MLLFFLPIEVNQNLANAVSCYKNLLDVKTKSIEETNDQDFQDFFNDEVISDFDIESNILPKQNDIIQSNGNNEELVRKKLKKIKKEGEIESESKK